MERIEQADEIERGGGQRASVHDFEPEVGEALASRRGVRPAPTVAASTSKPTNRDA
jgi:hypothetical protein